MGKGKIKISVIKDLDEKTILFRYATYHEVLIKIGNHRLSKQLTLDDLGDKKQIKAVTQRCYRDMAEDNLKIPALEYLCWISFQNLLYLMDKEIEEPNMLDEDSRHSMARKILKDFDLKFKEMGIMRERMELMALRQIMFLSICVKNRLNAKNMIRGFYKNERLFTLSNMIVTGFKTNVDISSVIYSFFNIINALNFYEFKMEMFEDTGAHIPDMPKINWNILFRQMIESIVITHKPWIHTELEKQPLFKQLNKG